MGTSCWLLVPQHESERAEQNLLGQSWRGLGNVILALGMGGGEGHSLRH